MPLAPVKLLRFLQTKEFRGGWIASDKGDVRVVAATNRELEAEVAEGASGTICSYGSTFPHPPPRCAIGARRAAARGPFLREIGKEITARRRLSRRALAALAPTMPGNVRQLEKSSAPARHGRGPRIGMSECDFVLVPLGPIAPIARWSRSQAGRSVARFERVFGGSLQAGGTTSRGRRRAGLDRRTCG